MSCAEIKTYAFREELKLSLKLRNMQHAAKEFESLSNTDTFTFYREFSCRNIFVARRRKIE